MVGYIIAMAAARPGLRNRGKVTVADAEPIEIIDYSGRVEEREFAVELETICSRRDASAHRQDQTYNR